MFTEEMQGRIDKVFSDFELMLAFIKTQMKNEKFYGEKALEEVVSTMEKSRDEAIEKFSKVLADCAISEEMQKFFNGEEK